MSSVEPFAKRIQRIMGDAIPDWMPRGTWHEKEYKHICRNLEDNFIDGKYPVKCNVKGNLCEKDIKYHQYASHLNSSQVMCISFFKKFFEKSAYEKILLEIFRRTGTDILSGAGIKDAIFEYEPDRAERTNFDFYIGLDDGRKISMEIKYTESEFGGISPDDKDPEKYHNKWENIYQAMVAANPYIDCDEQNFYDNYQINRNIVYAKEGDIVIFLTPKANNSSGIVEGRNYIDELGNCNVRNLYWEDIVRELLDIIKDLPELNAYYTKFYNKYIGILALQ